MNLYILFPLPKKLYPRKLRKYLSAFVNEPNLKSFAMFAKVKSPVFIDTLQLELITKKSNHISGTLKDEKGSVCSTLEKDLPRDQLNVTWSGLNDLPYGKYTLELLHGEDEMKLSLVKRV